MNKHRLREQKIINSIKEIDTDLEVEKWSPDYSTNSNGWLYMTSLTLSKKFFIEDKVLSLNHKVCKEIVIHNLKQMKENINEKIEKLEREGGLN